MFDVGAGAFSKARVGKRDAVGAADTVALADERAA
jgi:hypothetical protein